MVSSLAEQLAKGASLNANLLSEKTRRQAASESYLFSPKEARQHDLDSLHALAVNAFLQLRSLQPDLARFEHPLFSDSARSLDRTLQSKEQNADLDATISAFLPLLGPFLLDAPTGKVLEWLVRRFRIHEFNVPEIVSLFLPYHETPHFTKMVSILHISDRSPIRFLQAYKTAAKILHRPLLMNDMLAKSEVARTVAQILPATLKDHSGGVHRALITFHAGTLLEYVAKSKELDENAMALLLPAAMEPLQSASDIQSQVNPALLQETILGSYLVLAAISQKTHLTSKAIKSVLAAVVDCSQRVSPKQLVRTLVSVCAPQDQLEKLSSSLVKTLLKIPGIEAELIGSMAWIGAEKFLKPFMGGVLSRVDDPTAAAVAESILTSQLLPSVARSVASTLINDLVNEVAVESSILTLRRLLSHIYQRHPKAIEAAVQAIIDEDESQRNAVEQVVSSLSVTVSDAAAADAETATLLVSSTNADASVRAKAVRDLLSRLSDDNVPETEVQSISSMLLLRVHDTALPVLEALYVTEPEATTKAFLTYVSSSTAYIDALKQAVHSSSARPSRDILRTHLTFLLSHYLPAAAVSSKTQEQEQEESGENREMTRRAFMDIILSFLLYSKPRMKTAQAVWEILEAVESDGNDRVSFELLGGCVEAVRWEQARPGAAKEADKEGMGVQLLTKINLAVAAKIADNILASNYFKEHLDLLLEKLHDENPHARALGYLIVRALLNRLSGEQRIDAGHRVLEAMKLDTLEGMGDFMRGVEDVGTFLDDASVGTAIVLKPSSQNTLHRLQVAVLSVLPNFPRPTGVQLEWIAEHPSTSPAAATTDDVRAARYVQLLRAVYRLSNSSPSLPILSTHLLRRLFINLGDNALSFLSGIWLSPNVDEEMEAHIQYAALRHAGAFLEAHVMTQRTIDFQTVLPAMLVMLQSKDASVREAAVRCIAVVVKLSFAKEAEGVYAFDAVYGSGSSQLQYLDWADFQKYMKAIAENRDNLVHDPNYLQAFHHEHLIQVKGESKKNAQYKQRILCYLLSHVNSCPLLNVKVSLLRSVDSVSSEVKVQVLQPTIETLLSEQDFQGIVKRQQYQELATSAVSVFDITSAADLNDPGKPYWGVYEKVLSVSLKNGLWEHERAALLHRLQHGLFSKLNIDRKTQLSRTLLQTAAEDATLSLVCKNVLTALLDDVALVIRLLVSLQPQPSTEPSSQPASKRQKVDKVVPVAANEELSSLAVLAEVIGSLKITGTLELVSALLETLNKVASNTAPDTADRRFVEQLLMSAIENVVQNFSTATIVAPGSIRVDTLVEILRTSENPQTFHQACLLMASLARVAPDAVLHNVMPVFTFMGSNVFHRDDTYSFRVVQKTVDSIVPVMVSSLKEKHGSGMDLYQASRDFLRVFTNAANHIPRHRRVNFFSHLVDTLGPADFLAPVTMLLVDRVSNRVVRQNTTESSGSLFLPLAVSERYSGEMQLSSFVELVHEVQRLVPTGDSSTPPFLEETPDEEQTHADMTAKRRATALLIFCDYALKRLCISSLAHSEKERATSKELLALLLAVSAVKLDDESYTDVASAARSAMASTLGVMSAQDFVAGILTVLESGSVQVQSGALELLGERLREVAEKTRRTLTPLVIKITETVRHILSAGQEIDLVRAALHALATVSDTLSPGEEGSITATVPLVLQSLSRSEIRVPALKALLAFSTKLGPRTIPYLKDIVKECVARSQEVIAGGSGHSSTVSTASGILRNLLTSIPTFWAEAEVVQVIELYLDSTKASATDSAELSLLVRTTAKRASPNVLLPALCNMWTSVVSERVKDQPSKALPYIQMFKISVKAASRSAVLENLRELLGTFLSMFDFCASSRNSEVENALTSAFVEVVVKLNETAFRPIFRKMFDWAFAGGSSERKVVFCHVYSSLLDFFKGLMASYMTFAWPAFLEYLRNYSSDASEDGQLWLSITRTISKSMAADEDRVFWRGDKLRQLIPVAVQQVAVAVHVELTDSKTAVSECLNALLGLVDDDVMAKSLNLDVLMHSRSEDVRIRLFSLTCAEHMWRAHGDKLLGFVAETATFIAEAAEDENDRVVQEAHKLKAAVEAIGGTIDVS